MNAQRIRRHLSLESLETRTLLAGAGDLFGLNADFELAHTAITAIGDFSASFSTNWGNKQLVITGTNTSSLTIDLDRLPDFVTNLKISSFSSVTLVGHDDVDNLILRDIGHVSASELDVNVSVHATNVNSLSLASAGQNALLEGTTMDLTIRSLDDTMLFTNFDVLTLSSESDSLFVITENASQTLRLTYRPDDIQLVGMPSTSLKVILPGSTPPPVIDAGTGSGGSTGGTTTPSPELGAEGPVAQTPTSPEQPEEIIVINFPADERMRSFIAELRLFLKAAAEDPRQSPVDLSNFLAANANSTLLVLGQDEESATLMHTMLSTLPAEAHDVELPTLLAHLSTPVDELDSRPDTWGSAGNRLIINTSEQGLISPPIGNLEIGLTELAQPKVEPADNPTFLTTTTPERQEQSTISEIVDSVRAFGGFLAERVSSEFTPGQQSLVLLVDPKPTRGGTTNRNSALESFALGGGSAEVVVSVV